MRIRKGTSYKLLYMIGLTFGAAWSFMLAVGVIHHEWIVQCPTIGYWWAVLFILLIRSALNGLMVVVSEDWT